MGTQQFCLKWNNHHSNMLNVFEHLLSSEALVDVTLACEGLSIKAHKMVLSACSPFFQSLFLENPCKHPIVILKDMRYTDLKAIIDFMYRGEVNVSQNQLSALLKTAETLKVKGLAEVSGEDGQPNGSGIVQQEVIQQTVTQSSSTSGNNNSSTAQVTTTPSGNRAETPPLSRRKRGRPRRRSLSDSNRSDSEDQVPAKIRDRDIRDADSPEIIEDRDMDTNSSTAGVIEGSNGVQRLTLPSSTQVQPQTQQESRLTIDEVVSGDEADFVEPSKLMEQTMTTENVPVFPDAQSTGSSMSPASNQRLLLTNTTSLADRSLPSSSDSQAQVPVSLSSEIVVAGHSSQDIPEDIKPTGLVSFEEPPMSPVAGPSHHSQDSSSAMMMYMDSSGVPAIAGPSNYQPDKQSSSQQQSQPTQDMVLDLGAFFGRSDLQITAVHSINLHQSVDPHRLEQPENAKKPVKTKPKIYIKHLILRAFQDFPNKYLRVCHIQKHIISQNQIAKQDKSLVDSIMRILTTHTCFEQNDKDKRLWRLKPDINVTEKNIARFSRPKK